MTRQKMVRKIAKKTHQYESVVSDVINEYIELCRQQLLEGGAVVMRNFIKLEVRDRKPRFSRNPQTGKVEFYQTRKYVKCIASRKLRKEINGVFDSEDIEEEEES